MAALERENEHLKSALARHERRATEVSRPECVACKECEKALKLEQLEKLKVMRENEMLATQLELIEKQV